MRSAKDNKADKQLFKKKKNIFSLVRKRSHRVVQAMAEVGKLVVRFAFAHLIVSFNN